MLGCCQENGVKGEKKMGQLGRVDGFRRDRIQLFSLYVCGASVTCCEVSGGQL